MAGTRSADVGELLARVPALELLVRADLDRISVVLGQRVAERVAAGDPPTDVLLTATQADRAQLAGSSRESASRFLAVLERAGVISQGRGRLIVHNPPALEQYVF